MNREGIRQKIIGKTCKIKKTTTTSSNKTGTHQGARLMQFYEKELSIEKKIKANRI